MLTVHQRSSPSGLVQLRHIRCLHVLHTDLERNCLCVVGWPSSAPERQRRTATPHRITRWVSLGMLSELGHPGYIVSVDCVNGEELLKDKPYRTYANSN